MAGQRRLRLESVDNAVEQAKTAALNICGKPARHEHVPWFWSDIGDMKPVGLGQNTRIYDRDGKLLGYIAGVTNRTELPLSRIPAQAGILAVHPMPPGARNRHPVSDE